MNHSVLCSNDMLGFSAVSVCVSEMPFCTAVVAALEKTVT